MSGLKLPDPQPSDLSEGADAVAEAAAMAAGTDLSNRKDLNRFRQLLRDDKREGHIHAILLLSLWVGSLLILAMFGVLVWNMSVATSCRFLTPEQMQTLQQFLFSGFIGGALTAAGRKLAGNNGAD